MKKKAIIIATPNLPGQKKLPGATKDLEAWSNFLHSAEGGAWNDDEITILSDPSPDLFSAHLEIKKALNLDFALLAFSGHGSFYKRQYTEDTETRMSLSETAYFTEFTFSVRAKRELIIADACREYGGEILVEKIANAVRAMEAFAGSENRLARAREEYERAIASSPEGRSIVYSCSLNQTAGDVSSFTRFLISDAIGLAKKMPVVGTVSIKQAFEAAESKPAIDNYPQQPIYSPGRRTIHLPFSVSV